MTCEIKINFCQFRESKKSELLDQIWKVVHTDKIEKVKEWRTARTMASATFAPNISIRWMEYIIKMVLNIFSAFLKFQLIQHIMKKKSKNTLVYLWNFKCVTWLLQMQNII